ncbi:MAG: hypothetical protein LW884_07005 [Bacteroidetes bacterium]|jgi:hypothetical protein|nr:hypothetical protein [Bacteroidota bacterium]
MSKPCVLLTLLPLLGLLAACSPCSELGTTTLREVRDTLVVSPGAQLHAAWLPTRPYVKDTGRLRLRLQPVWLPSQAAGTAALQLVRVQAACVPDTIRVPKVVREYTTHTRARARRGFWHYSGIAFWALLLVLGFTFSIRKYL